MTNDKSKKVVKKVVKKIIKKTTSKKSKQAVKKEQTKKKIIKKVAKPIKKKKVEVADAPTDLNAAGWKKKLLEKKSKIQPKCLRPKEELWGKKPKASEMEKRKKGLVILIDGEKKVGKTNFALSASQFHGFEGKRRIIPCGYPVYVLDTENTVEDEADIHYAEEYDAGKIKIQVVYKERGETKELDPIASMEELEEWAYSLDKEQQGTLVIDNFTDYGEWAADKLNEVVLGHKLDANGVSKNKATPMQYSWKNKKIKNFLRKLRNMSGMNIILVGQVKDDWVNDDPSDPYGGRKTGLQLSDVAKKTDYWVDIIARYEKEKNVDGSVKRRLIITDSRFESEDMADEDFYMEGSPSISEMIEKFKHKL